MILEKIYKEAYYKKEEEIFERYNNEKVVAAPGKLPKFQKIFKDNLKKEYQRLFCNSPGVDKDYHFIEKFKSKMPGVEDSYLTFDKDFSNTKEFIKDMYKDHDYEPKVDLFFLQSDEVIVKKLGEQKAYDELRFNFVQALVDNEKKEGASAALKDTDLLNDLQKSNPLEGHPTTMEQARLEKGENERR